MDFFKLNAICVVLMNGNAEEEEEEEWENREENAVSHLTFLVYWKRNQWQAKVKDQEKVYS